jgi:indole-3-glycerol phosphate synthase
MNISVDIPDILKKIVETKKHELETVATLKNDFIARADDAVPALDFGQAISQNGLSVIAEIKKASPSAGIISHDFDPVKFAKAYKAGGADAVSVLTDVEYFKGSPEYIPMVREYLPEIPILRKDFIISESQIYEARALGADSFLLIAAILTVGQLQDFIGLGRQLGMEPLVESHTAGELEKTIESGATIFGVNNRNLHTFEVSLDTSVNLYGMIPADGVKVGESGIRSQADAARLAKAGYNAILVGESLMSEGFENCGKKISEFKRSGN